jgi:hypothetical protein
MKAFSPEKFPSMKDSDIKGKITGLPKHKIPCQGLTDADIDNVIAYMRTIKK